MIHDPESVFHLLGLKTVVKRGSGVQDKQTRAENGETHYMPHLPFQAGNHDQNDQPGKAQQRPDTVGNGIGDLFFDRLLTVILSVFHPHTCST